MLPHLPGESESDVLDGRLDEIDEDVAASSGDHVSLTDLNNQAPAFPDHEIDGIFRCDHVGEQALSQGLHSVGEVEFVESCPSREQGILACNAVSKNMKTALDAMPIAVE